MNDLTQYMIADEGFNWDSRQKISNSKELIELKEALTAAKTSEKAWKKTKKQDKNLLKQTITAYEKAVDNAMALKNFVNNVEEPTGGWQKFCSYFTPIFSFKFPEKELNSLMVIPMGNSTYMSIQTTTYTDRMSKGTASALKRSWQERMNLFIKSCKDTITWLKRFQ